MIGLDESRPKGIAMLAVIRHYSSRFSTSPLARRMLICMNTLEFTICDIRLTRELSDIVYTVFAWIAVTKCSPPSLCWVS